MRQRWLQWVLVTAMLLSLLPLSAQAQAPASGAPPGGNPLLVLNLGQDDGAPLPIAVDAGQPVGHIRSLQGLNGGPHPDARNTAGTQADLTQAYRDLGVDFVRTHDYFGPCDLNAIFPDWNADPTLEGSYRFASTDHEIEGIIASGAHVLFRLGYSWGTPRAAVTYVAPADRVRWAEVCRRVVMHYNADWANGMQLGIRYWEVWNEPDIAVFWTGTPQEYYALYGMVAQTLKAYDPTLKVGGPALAGNLQFLEGFLAYCQAQQVPLDFLSWHLYSEDAAAYRARSLRIQEYMARYGFGAVEQVLDEWNCGLAGGDSYWNAHGAAFTAATLTYLQDTPVQISTRYRGNLGGQDGRGMGLWYDDGRFKKATYSYVALRAMLETPVRLATPSSDTQGLAILAGKDEASTALSVLISQTQPGAKAYELTISALPWGGKAFLYDRYLLDAQHDLTLVESRVISGTNVFRASESLGADSVQLLRLHLPQPSVFLVSIDGIRGTEAFDAPDPSVYVPNLWRVLKPQGTVYSNLLNRAQTYTTPANNTLVNGEWAFAPNIEQDLDLRPYAPTVFEYYRQTYPTVAAEKTWAVVGKGNVRHADYSLHPAYGQRYGAQMNAPAAPVEDRPDMETWAEMQRVLDIYHPTLVFLHLGQVDTMAHTNLWDRYLSAIRQADDIVGQLWTRLQSDPAYRDVSTLIVTSDHGRHDDAHGGFSSHGGICDGDKRLPLVALGRGIRAGQVVTATHDQVDIAPTVGALLGFQTPWAEGQVLGEMLVLPTDTAHFPVTATQTSNAPLTDSTGQATRPDVAANATGLHVVWSDDRMGTRQVYWQNSADGGATWSRYLVLSQGDAETRAPAIAATDDAVHVAWLDYRAGDWVLYHRRYTPATGWSPEAVITHSVIELPGQRSGAPQMLWDPALAGSGTRAVTAFPAYMAAVRAGGGTGLPPWGEASLSERANQAHGVALAAESDDVYAAWVQLTDQSWQLYASRSTDGGQTWSAAVSVTTQAHNACDPALGAANGKLHLVWADDRSGAFQVYYKVSTNGGASWSLPRALSASTPGAGAWRPDVDVSGGVLTLVWEDYRDGAGEVYARRSMDSGATWTSEARLTHSAGTSARPRLAHDARSEYLVWQAWEDGHWQVRVTAEVVSPERPWKVYLPCISVVARAPNSVLP